MQLTLGTDKIWSPG